MLLHPRAAAGENILDHVRDLCDLILAAHGREAQNVILVQQLSS
jgi:hypothetical protein